MLTQDDLSEVKSALGVSEMKDLLHLYSKAKWNLVYPKHALINRLFISPHKENNCGFWQETPATDLYLVFVFFWLHLNLDQ